MELVIDLHFLPNIEYFCALFRHKRVLLESNESYVKGSYRNKAFIVTSNGRQRLSIPLKRGKHQQKNIQAVEISDSEDWQRQHWKSIKTAYENAPFWEDYADELATLLLHPSKTLWVYNLNLLQGLIDILQLECDIGFTKEYQKAHPERKDLRQRLHPKNDSWVMDNIEPVAYGQVFEDRQHFIPNVSIIDLIFCKGPEAILVLERMLP